MLKTLNHYAMINGLEINFDKTKVMIFNRTGRHIRRKFYLGNMRIETAREYKYLGFKITPYGGINPGLNDLKDRALKAFYKMKHQMGTSFRKHPLITIISLLTNINHTPKTAQYIFRMSHCREFLTNNHRNST